MSAYCRVGFEAFTDGAVPFVSTARENGTGLYFCGFFVCSIYLQLVAPSCHLFERWGKEERNSTEGKAHLMNK